MALDESAVLEVLEALKAAEVDDRIWQTAERIYQALFEAALASVIGALPHERTSARTGHRNGHRLRVLVSTAGIWSCGSQAALRHVLGRWDRHSVGHSARLDLPRGSRLRRR